MGDKLQMQYDSICYHLFNGVQNLSHGADCINFKNFDYKNDEHLLLLAVTVACSGILQKEIKIDCPSGARRRLAAKYKAAVAIKKNDGSEEQQIDVPELLDGLRGYACQLCGAEFRFGDIYHAYYCEE